MKKSLILGTFVTLLCVPSLMAQRVSGEENTQTIATPVVETVMMSRAVNASDFKIDQGGTIATITVDPETSTAIYDEKGNLLVSSPYVSGSTKMHVWFTLTRQVKPNEKVYAQSDSVKTGKAGEKIWFTLEEQPESDSMPIYRVYNPNNGGHLYTANQGEAMKIVTLGWQDENIAWDAPKTGEGIYRLYNPNTGEHFYTTDMNEYNVVAKAGWNKEGQAFYSDTEKEVPVYRVFNPNAKGPGSHHYTTSAGEKDSLVALGWKDEGTAFYGVTK